ncbi:MAG TPA: GAF domain-containing protein [Anaerolineales bacterium]|nr:GAF domain-containing protein [Anaerolineales bacterium]
MTTIFKNSRDFVSASSARLWHGLTEPLVSLPEAGDNRRSGTTAAFFLFAILAVLIEHSLAGNTPASLPALLIGGYFLARTRWFRYAALILIFSLSFPSYLVALRLQNPDPQRVMSAFGWVIVPLLITSLIYPVRVTVALGAINFLALAVIPLVRPELNYRLLSGTLGFYGLATSILVIVMNQRNQIENDRQKELITNREKLSQEIHEKEKFAERSQLQADQLAMLYKISNAISNLRDLESILHLIFEKVKDNIHLDVFFIALYDDKSGIVSFPLMYDGDSFWKEPEKNIRETKSLSKVIATGDSFLWNRTSAEIEAAKVSTNRVGDSTRVAASIIVIPLQAAGRIIGAISVQSYQTNAYNENHLLLLTSLAQQATVAIENSRLYDAANKRAQRLKILNEVSRAVAELKDLPDLLEIVYELVAGSIAMDAFYVGLYQPETQEISFPIMYDEGRRYQREPEPISEGIFLDRFLNGENAILINQAAEEIANDLNKKRMLGNVAKPSASLMVAPLKSGDEVIGLISAQSYTTHAYDEADLNLMLGIANQVAVAIQNAGLLKEVQQNAKHLSILNEVGHAVSELRDLPHLLEVVYDQVKHNLNVDAFFVGLYHPENDTVSYPIAYDDGIRYESPAEAVSATSYLYRLLHGEAATLTNRTAEELTVPPSREKMFGNTSKKSASLINAPLIIREQVIGVISAQSYTLNAYKQEDLTLMIGIAGQVSIALENSQLYTSAQQEITERQKVEDQLRAAEAKYRELVERSPAVIYNSETGAAGRWFYVSPQIETLLGFTADEWTADPNLWYQQIHPEDREYVITTEARAIAENRSLETEYRMYTKDGRLVWIHDESLNVSISENQQYIVQGVLSNVTFRKQAELDLRESEEKYHSLFNTAQRQARELTLLGEVQSALARELELSILLKTVVEAVAKTFGYTFVSLYILENDSLQLQHQVGYESEYVIERIPAEEGVSGKVVRTGQPVLIKDVVQDPSFLRASPLIKSEICVPLFDNNKVFGTLNVESSLEYQLTEDDLRLLNNLSEQINIAIRRARLYMERAESLKREQHINDFAHAINSTHALADILELVARLSVEMVGADGGSVSVMSDDGLTMTDVYSYHDDHDLDSIIQKGKGITWWTYERGGSIILDEYSQHPNAAEILMASAIHAFMGVPISIGDKRLGAMALYNKTPQRKFTSVIFP